MGMNAQTRNYRSRKHTFAQVYAGKTGLTHATLAYSCLHNLPINISRGLYANCAHVPIRAFSNKLIADHIACTRPVTYQMTTYSTPESNTFSLTYLGRFTAHNFGSSSSEAIHSQLIEYYIAYLRRAYDNQLPFDKLNLQNPIECRLVSLEDNALSVRSWRFRKFNENGTLINEREVYKTERIVLCDCLCFEVVQSASRNIGICFAYLRRASDARHTIPESNLRELDLRLSQWLLKYRRFPRPPLLVVAIHRALADNCIDLLVFLAPNQATGLDFVRRITELTYVKMPTKPQRRVRRRARTADSRYVESPSRSPRRRASYGINKWQETTKSDTPPPRLVQSRATSADPLIDDSRQGASLPDEHTRSKQCQCLYCRSMGVLPDILTTDELEKVRNRLIQYQLSQEAVNHVYKRNPGPSISRQSPRQSRGGTQSKVRSSSCKTTLQEGQRQRNLLL